MDEKKDQACMVMASVFNTVSGADISKFSC